MTSARPAAPIALLLLTLSLPAFAGGPSVTRNEPKMSSERLVLHTTLGDMAFALFPVVAPRHVAQIEKLVKLGVYNGTYFYRVEPNFVVQLADARDRLTPLTAEQSAAIKPLQGEFSSLRHVRGVLSMAHADNDPDSATTSFSILLADAPHLDGKYTIFGRLVQGEDVLETIADQPIDAQHRPLDRIGLVRSEIVDARRLASVMKPAPRLAPKPQRQEPPRVWLVLVTVMTAVGLAIFFTAGRISPAATAGLGMLIVLIGYFLMFLVLAPHSRENSLLAVALFVGSIAVFKAMSYFERAR